MQASGDNDYVDLPKVSKPVSRLAQARSHSSAAAASRSAAAPGTSNVQMRATRQRATDAGNESTAEAAAAGNNRSTVIGLGQSERGAAAPKLYEPLFESHSRNTSLYAVPDAQNDRNARMEELVRSSNVLQPEPASAETPVQIAASNDASSAVNGGAKRRRYKQHSADNHEDSRLPDATSHVDTRIARDPLSIKTHDDASVMASNDTAAANARVRMRSRPLPEVPHDDDSKQTSKHVRLHANESTGAKSKNSDESFTNACGADQPTLSTSGNVYSTGTKPGDSGAAVARSTIENLSSETAEQSPDDATRCRSKDINQNTTWPDTCVVESNDDADKSKTAAVVVVNGVPKSASACDSEYQNTSCQPLSSDPVIMVLNHEHANVVSNGVASFSPEAPELLDITAAAASGADDVTAVDETSTAITDIIASPVTPNTPNPNVFARPVDASANDSEYDVPPAPWPTSGIAAISQGLELSLASRDEYLTPRQLQESSAATTNAPTAGATASVMAGASNLLTPPLTPQNDSNPYANQLTSVTRSHTTDDWLIAPPPTTADAPPPYMPRGVLEKGANKSLKEAQVEELQKQQRCSGGVQITMCRRDCYQNIAFIECLSAVW